MNQIATLNRRCLESTSTNWTQGNIDCVSPDDFMCQVSGDTFSYDGNLFEGEWDRVETPVVLFLSNATQRGKLYEAIHVDKSPKQPIYEWSSQAVSDAYSFEMAEDWSKYYDNIMTGEVGILIYSGEYDLTDGPTTQDPWLILLRKLNATANFWHKPRQIYYLPSTNPAFEVGGYYREDKGYKLTVLTVPKAGHFVPTFNL